MLWDFHTGHEYIRIEIVQGDEVLGLVAEIPVGGLTADGHADAERAAEAICNAHNTQIAPVSGPEAE